MNATEIDFNNHPCFSKDAHKKYGRVHLPVAPRCNMQCNFCNRKCDCMNESRPGVTSAVLTPQQAVAYLACVVEKRPEIAVMGIAGPGDPFANPEETMQTLRLVRKQFPEMILCVATNGLNVAPYVDEMADLKVSHVTLTINAVDPAIGAEIYAWVRDGKTRFAARKPQRPVEAPADGGLGAAQGAASSSRSTPLSCRASTTITFQTLPKISALGADIMNCMALVPVKGAAFENVPPPDDLTMMRVRLQCGLHLPQMTHCARCRVDAVGYIGESMTPEQHDALKH